MNGHTATKPNDFNNEVALTDTILVTERSTTYELPDDGFNRNRNI